MPLGDLILGRWLLGEPEESGGGPIESMAAVATWSAPTGVVVKRYAGQVASCNLSAPAGQALKRYTSDVATLAVTPWPANCTKVYAPPAAIVDLLSLDPATSKRYSVATAVLSFGVTGGSARKVYHSAAATLDCSSQASTVEKVYAAALAIATWSVPTDNDNAPPSAVATWTCPPPSIRKRYAGQVAVVRSVALLPGRSTCFCVFLGEIFSRIDAGDCYALGTSPPTSTQGPGELLGDILTPTVIGVVGCCDSNEG